MFENVKHCNSSDKYQGFTNRNYLSTEEICRLWMWHAMCDTGSCKAPQWVGGSVILPQNVLFLAAWRSNFPTFEVRNPDDSDH